MLACVYDAGARCMAISFAYTFFQEYPLPLLTGICYPWRRVSDTLNEECPGGSGGVSVLFHVEVVVVYDGLVAFAAHVFFGREAVVLHAAVADGVALAVFDADNVVFLEVAFDARYADRQQADGGFGVEGVAGGVADVDGAFGESLAVGNPFLDARHGIGGRHEAGADGVFVFVEQVGQDVVARAVGDEHFNAFVGYLAGYAGLGEHSAAPER